MSDDPDNHEAPYNLLDAGITLASPQTVVMDPREAHPPGIVTELAANAVRFMLATCKIEPDFSRESLAFADFYVKEARDAVKARPETLAVTVNALGAYLGEIARRIHKCWWRIDHKDYGSWRLEFEQVWLAFYPMQVAHVSLTLEDDSAGFSGFEMKAPDRDALLARLDNLPGVSEEAYFAPSTKIEILDIAVDALLAQRAQQPHEARPYVPVDYEAH
ncbi:MAG: hypothetical protein AAGA56_15860 [Myxococcota bacterium]